MARRGKPIIALSFLLYPSEDVPGQWVAHCLQLDVVALGRGRPKAITLLKELITELFAAAEQDGTLDKVYRPAPLHYWQMLQNAEPYKPPHHVEDVHIEAAPVKRVDYVMART